ncbi:crossover junction endodeoxyribonuclease RuvC [Limisalsivibrio acetivorans]|uniref:crossover junction endodeoxyribonuclease RuvC n=1 Tax=Limisalsivibrio acetivorans TaxID=1304888 RepID=UPI0003B333DE|nr:crossover junction endodeoxyribonuclease RuvC [Limisalsivibrio acetivorans]
MSVVVLGVDPGLNCTGVGFVRAWPGKVEYIHHAVIRTNSKDTLPHRLGVICSNLGDLIDEYKPEVSSVEDFFHSVNPKSAMLLGQTRGAIIATLLSRELPVYEYTALQVKKSVVGYGKAEKSQVKKMVEVLLGINMGKVPLDATDALACGICLALNITGRRF